MGGTGAIVDALGRLMIEAGVTVQLEKTVASVRCDSGRVRGVELESGESIAADIVISNADPLYLYGQLLDARRAPSGPEIKKDITPFKV